MAKNVFSIDEIYKFANATHSAQKLNRQFPTSKEDWATFVDENEDCVTTYNEDLTLQEQSDFDNELLKNAPALKSDFDKLEAKNLSMDDRRSIISDIEYKIKQSSLSAFIR